MLRLFKIILPIYLLSGCAVLPKIKPSSLSKTIDRDAQHLNEAHTQAINGVIALNILRARDRWPTGYTTLSGIQYRPSLATNLSADFDPLGLGNPPLPFGNSTAAIARNHNAEAFYTVNPFAESSDAPSLYSAAASETLFARYVNSRWPMEVLFPLFVKDATLNGSVTCHINGKKNSSKITGYVGAVDSLFKEDMSNETTKNCEEVIKALRLKDHLNTKKVSNFKSRVTWDYENIADYDCQKPKQDNIEKNNGANMHVMEICTKKTRKKIVEEWVFDCEKIDDNLFGISSSSLATRITDIQNAVMAIDDTIEARVKIDAEDPQICTRSNERKLFATVKSNEGIKTYKVDLDLNFRSFDEMVYFVGETLRGKDDDEKPQTLTVNYCGKDEAVPLFSYDTKFELQTHAVTVSHAGKDYSILHKSKPTASCSADRSGTVLSLLSQILLLNQSEEFLRAPDNILL